MEVEPPTHAKIARSGQTTGGARQIKSEERGGGARRPQAVAHGGSWTETNSVGRIALRVDGGWSVAAVCPPTSLSTPMRVTVRELVNDVVSHWTSWSSSAWSTDGCAS